jgi:putative ABC transport system ATP-binding protein
MALIQITNLQKVFRTELVETVALNSVSLAVEKGEFVAIMGPSGCGKSTLLNILGLLDNPTSGQYLLDGQDVGSLKESQRTKVRKGQIGFVFQSFNLIDELNVEENVELPLTYLGVPKKERKKRVEEVLRRMAISHRAHHFPQQLSGGQQQRVAIARALVNDPVIVLADEATGNLDTRTSYEIMSLFQSLHEQGKTIAFVTHESDIAVFTSRTIFLRDGHILRDEPVETKSAAEALAALPIENDY